MVDLNATGKFVREQYEDKKQMSAYALIVALLSGGGGYTGFNAAIDAADARWMTYTEHAAGDMKSHIRSLRREIRDIEYDIGQGTATDRNKWELERLLEDLEEAQEELEGMI